MSDQNLIVYGANCCWWDSIDKSGMMPGSLQDPARPRSGLPCCPHCKSVLFQQDEAQWFDGMKRHEDDGNPGYLAMMNWSRGKCFKKMSEMKAAYALEAKT